MGRLGEYDFASQMLNTIRSIVQNEIQKVRPRHQYATVSSINRAGGYSMVTFTGESTPVKVLMGSVQPSATGQVVRIEGVHGDRYIADVMGTGGSSLQTPAGLMMPFAGSASPDTAEWLIADGSTVSRTTYARLFAVIGTAYNTGGEAGTVFRLPNMKGRVAVGRDAGQTEFDTLGETGGEKEHTLAVGEMPTHAHNGDTDTVNSAHNHGSTVRFNNTLTGGGSNTYVSDIGGVTGASGGSTGTLTVNTTGSTHTHGIASQGGGNAHNNLQPYTVTNFLIKT